MEKEQLYRSLLDQAEALLAGESDPIANAANLSALIYHALPEVNWVGFYFARGEELVVGPFQGRPACVRIPLGEGVCGTAAREQRSLVVDDVHRFEGHIACDAASNSEIVIPLARDGRLVGVLDLDSPLPGRFDQQDLKGLEALAGLFLERCRSKVS